MKKKLFCRLYWAECSGHGLCDWFGELAISQISSKLSPSVTFGSKTFAIDTSHAMVVSHFSAT